MREGRYKMSDKEPRVDGMKLVDGLQDIFGLDEKLRELEKQYGLLSDDLYALYRLGELEQTKDLIRWVGYYELRQERQKRYGLALRERLFALRQQNQNRPLTLEPHFALLKSG